MAPTSSIQMSPKAPGVINNASVAGSFQFFLADGTAGTIANGLFKKDSTGTVTPLLPAGSVSSSMLAQAPANTMFGNNTAGTADRADLTVAQVNALLGWTAWSTYTPVLTQGVTVATSSTNGRYKQIGKTVFANVWLQASGTGTAGSVITVSLPVTGTSAQNIFVPPGDGLFFDNSAAQFYSLTTCFDTGWATVKFMADQAPVTGSNFLGATSTAFAQAVAASDQMGFTVLYEVP